MALSSCLRSVSSVEKVSARRSEEHTSELQSRLHLVCRLLLEKKNNNVHRMPSKAALPISWEELMSQLLKWTLMFYSASRYMPASCTDPVCAPHLYSALNTWIV